MKKSLDVLKNKLTEKNNTITKVKNTLKWINSWISEAEEWISELEGKLLEINSKEQNKVKRRKSMEDILRDIWENIKCMSSGHTQTQFCLSLCVALGPGVHKVRLSPLECLWKVWGLILNVTVPLIPYFWGFSFAPGRGISPQSHSSVTQLLLQHTRETSVSQFSHSVVSDSLQLHGRQHTRPPCPSPIPGVYSNSCPLSLWCHPTISSSVVPFSSSLQLSSPSPPAFNLSQHQSPFQWVSPSHQVAKVLEFQLQHQSIQWTFRTDYI